MQEDTPNEQCETHVKRKVLSLAKDVTDECGNQGKAGKPCVVSNSVGVSQRSPYEKPHCSPTASPHRRPTFLMTVCSSFLSDFKACPSQFWFKEYACLG